jgi:tRNA (guanine-N7-)-methyltransferase|tara:strand:+ start:749 stop:1456 length:708 start_codon:yes stop_codon:yes gene_type:complete
LNNLTVNKEQRFYGRRKGRKLSESSQIALKQGENFYIIKLEDFFKNKHNSTSQSLFGIDHKKIILEIGFGSGDNLVNSAINNPNICYIGADPFLNTNARLIKILLKNNIKNIKIWPDDIRKIIPLFSYSSVSEIKILFPDPWPKSKHKNRRLVQEIFIDNLYKILVPNGRITLATDHSLMKSWILEIFQSHKGYLWQANTIMDWKNRPADCFSTKYEQKSYVKENIPSWFVFKKI